MRKPLERSGRQAVQATYWRVMREFAVCGVDVVALHAWLKARGAAPFKSKLPPWAVNGTMATAEPLREAFDQVVGVSGVMAQRAAVARKRKATAGAAAP